MKPRRHMRILELIRERPISTQDQLTGILCSEGIAVTQATISRDIRDLRLVKVPGDDGHYRYALPDDPSGNGRVERLRRHLHDLLVGVDFAENIIVLRTLPGTANTVAVGIDRLGWPEVLGTIAGDDTILVVVRSRELTQEIAHRLREFGY
ncbi:MAG TPA: arginine repressor [Bacillota bacterium]|nr:arginine repressor [Bacillota bacterium]